MNDQEEVKFWLKARKIIEDGYGARCKEFVWGCASCEAGLVKAWIERHVMYLEEDIKLSTGKDLKTKS